jgi:hypothetical protein
MPRTFSYTTEVFDEYTDFPQTGDVDTIYIDASKNKAYRYDQSYYPISSEGVDIWGAIGSLSKGSGGGGGGGGGGASWGSINGTLTNQTDLNTALSAKQDTLTLTTTGTSGAATLVDSTLNIPQYGGGASGLKGPHVLTGNVAGSTFFGFTAAINGAAIATITPTTNRLDVYPFYPNKTLTNCSLIVNVSTLGVGVSGRIVVYADLNGYPNSKIYESTNLDLSTIGDKTALAGITFNAGSVYWLGFYANGSALMRALSATSLAPIFAANANTSPTVAWSRVGTTLGSAPNPFAYNTYAAAAQVLIFIKPA